MCGSVASSLHGIPRATQDVDLVIDPNTASLERFVRAAAARDYYVDDQDAHEALDRRSMFNVIDPGSGYKLDLIVRRQRSFSVEEFARRRPVTVSGVRAYVVSPEDALLSKLEWVREGGSERQFLDALGIALVQGEILDTPYLRRWARENYVPRGRRQISWHPVVHEEMERKEFETTQSASAPVCVVASR